MHHEFPPNKQDSSNQIEESNVIVLMCINNFLDKVKLLCETENEIICKLRKSSDYYNQKISNMGYLNLDVFRHVIFYLDLQSLTALMLVTSKFQRKEEAALFSKAKEIRKVYTESSITLFGRTLTGYHYFLKTTPGTQAGDIKNQMAKNMKIDDLSQLTFWINGDPRKKLDQDKRTLDSYGLGNDSTTVSVIKLRGD